MRHHSPHLKAGPPFAAVPMAAPALAKKSGETEFHPGVIEGIASARHGGVGAVRGAIVGIIGIDVQEKHEQPIPAQQAIEPVRSGVLVAVTQPTDTRLITGRKTDIGSSGDGARSVPQ